MNSTKLFIIFLFALTFGLVNKSHAQFRSGQIVYLTSAAGEVDLNLAPQNGAVSQQTPIVVHPQNNSYAAASKWKLENAGGDWFFIRNIKSNMMLDVREGKANPGNSLWLWPKNGSDAQKFRFRQFDKDPSLYLIESKLGTDLRIDLANSIPTSGSKAIISRELQGRRAQKWKIVTDAAPNGNDLRLPKATFVGIAHPIFNQLQVRLSNHGPRHRDSNGDISWFKERDSYIRLENSNQTFTMPKYTRGVRDKRSYIYDIKLQRVRTRFLSNDELSVNLKFEEDGPEIKSYCSNCIQAREDNAAPDYHLTNNQWEIRLSLIPYNGTVSYKVNSVKFLGEVDGQGLGELSEDIIQTCLIPAFEKEIKDVLASSKGALASSTRQKAQEMGLDLTGVTRISIEGKDLIFHRR